MAALALFVGFAGCSKDDGGGPAPVPSVSDVIGKWYVINVEEYEIEDGERLTWDNSYTKDKTWWYTFFEDGTFEYIDDFLDLDPGVDPRDIGSWSLEGDQLTLDFGYDDTVYTVKSFSSTTLVILTEWNSEFGDIYYGKTLTLKKTN